jgi:site-specific recombinase XerD
MINRQNYQLIDEYLLAKIDSGALSDLSIKRYRSWARHLILWADETTLQKAAEIKPTYIAYLQNVITKKGKPLSRESWKKLLMVAVDFFNWVKESKKRQVSALSDNWIKTLRIPHSIKSEEDDEFVSFNEITKLCSISQDSKNLVGIRETAAAAFLYCSGIRVGAFVSLPISAVNIAERSIKQWPEWGVKTKNGKKQTTYMLEIPELIRVIEQWDNIVKKESGKDGYWYAPLRNEWGEKSFSNNRIGEHRDGTFRKNLKNLFVSQDMVYKSPHKFRRGYTSYIRNNSPDLAHFQAASRNMMHETPYTTIKFYSKFDQEEMKNKIKAIGNLGKNANPLLNERDTTKIVKLVAQLFEKRNDGRIKATNYQQDLLSDEPTEDQSQQSEHNDEPFQETDDPEIVAV